MSFSRRGSAMSIARRSGARFTASGGEGGISPPELPDFAAIILDIDASFCTLSGADITSIADQSSRGLTATGVAAKYPQYDATGGVNGGPAIVCTGGQCMTLSAALRTTSGPVTVMAVYNDTSPSDGFRYIIDSTTSRRMIEQMTSAGQVGYYDGTAHRTIAPALRGAQCVTWTLQSGTGGRAYRGRMDLGASTTSYTEAAMGGSPTALFSDRGLATQFAHAKFDRIIVWNKVLSASELTQAWNFIDSVYGVCPRMPGYTALETAARFTGPTADGVKGVTRWDVTSAHSSASARVEILLPAAYALSTARRWPVLYVLPAYEGPPSGVEDGQAYIRALGWHSTQECIVVQVAYPTAPWVGNHASDATKAQRRYILETVQPFIEAAYQGAPERSARCLIGYSKSGVGGMSLLLEHQDTIGYAVSWDGPLMFQSGDYGVFDSATAFGTNGAWDAWLARDLLVASPPPDAYARLIITGDDAADLYGPGPGGTYAGDEHTAGFATLCTSEGVARTLNNSLAGAHNWSSGWLATALAALVTAKDAGDAADPPSDPGAEFA